MSRRRRWVLGITLVAGVLTVGLLVAATRIPFSSNTLRKRVVGTLAEQLKADVTLEGLTLHFAPRLQAVGTDLVVRYQGRRDVPPLISIKTFTVTASLRNIWRGRVDHVSLEGLDIQIPPGGKVKADDATGSGTPEPKRDDGAASGMGAYARSVVISELEAPNASLTILRKDPAKPSRVWYLHSLTMQEVGADRPMPFQALLTNGVPPGQIDTTGSFGPWQRDEPGDTPLEGRFSFQNADLSVFHGISGILSATGTFGGTLDRIGVDGRTETPDFMVNVSGHPVPLTTTYHAVVDGTNGDTTLDPVHATFLETSVTARGGVYDTAGPAGRVVRLNVSIEDGRIEDLMRLAVKTPTSPMTGQVFLSTEMVIPPGKVDVVDKLQLNGRFAIDDGRFTDAGVQQKVNDMSRRALGRPAPQGKPAKVTSDFKGRFALGNARLALPVVTFDVPGAIVELGGAYGLRRETIDFSGALYMDAKLSETVEGFKSLILKLADPLFRKDGRTVVPLKIDGTRNDPHFGVDMKRVFTSKSDGSKSAPAKPAAKPTAQSKPQPKAASKPQPNAQPKPQPKAQPNAQPKPQPNAHPSAQPKPQPNAQPSTQPKPQTRPN